MIHAVRSLIAAVAAVIAAVTAAVTAATYQPVILKLNSVACASPAYCLAVGQNVTYGRSFAEVWDGNAWRMIPAPNPGVPAALWDVACFAVRRCLTVGTYFDAAGFGVALAAEWDGTRWRLLDPASPGIVNQLGGIACPRRDDCVAVGASLVTTYQPFAEQWDGSRWRQLPAPIPAGSGGELNAVACPLPTRCVAVGSLGGAGGKPRTLAEAWNGSRWHVLATPAGSGNLVDVSCARPAMCVATGYSYAPSGAALRVLTEEWDGKAWRLLPFDGPASAGSSASQLPGVACGLASAGCLAVGNYLNGAGRGRTLAGVWDGTPGGGWRVLTPVYPAGSEAVLTDVACPSPTRCMAIGDYDFTVGNLPFAELWDGSQWRLLGMPRR